MIDNVSNGFERKITTQDDVRNSISQEVQAFLMGQKPPLKDSAHNSPSIDKALGKGFEITGKCPEDSESNRTEKPKAPKDGGLKSWKNDKSHENDSEQKTNKKSGRGPDEQAETGKKTTENASGGDDGQSADLGKEDPDREQNQPHSDNAVQKGKADALDGEESDGMQQHGDRMNEAATEKPGFPGSTSQDSPIQKPSRIPTEAEQMKNTESGLQDTQLI